MKIIINAEPDEMAYVLRLTMGARKDFDRGPERLGWGWVYGEPGKRRFFIRQIKGGLSAKPNEFEIPA